MSIKPFLKWAGGKRWLADRDDFEAPSRYNRYIEPFLGGGAIYFSLLPPRAILSDINPRLIELYKVIKASPEELSDLLKQHHQCHSKEYYYETRSSSFDCIVSRAAQFLYLNRACWNGLYRENLKGEFNVPIGTKTAIYLEGEDFAAISVALANAQISCCDFEATINNAGEGDFLFVDPPYTTAHNFNGFVKYNQKIFTWEDQVRLKDSVVRAAARGAMVMVTNADHASVSELYSDIGSQSRVSRASVISGRASGRQATTELLITCNL